MTANGNPRATQPPDADLPPQPKSDEGRKEFNRMRRLKSLSQNFWDATKGLLALIGAAAPVTYALGSDQLAHSQPEALGSLLGAAVVVCVGAVCFFLVQGVAESRRWSADDAAKSRKAAYLLLGAFLLMQLFALPAAAFFQANAVYLTLRDRQMIVRHDLDNQLIDRLILYLTYPSAIAAVQQYCTKHISDDEVSARFMSTCATYAGKSQPSSNATKKAIASLRADS